MQLDANQKDKPETHSINTLHKGDKTLFWATPSNLTAIFGNKIKKTRKKSHSKKSGHKKHKLDEIKEHSKSYTNTNSTNQKFKGELEDILNNDPYNVLEISPKANRRTIKRAYKKRAVEVHPDKGGSSDDFIRLRRAYEILMDDK